MTSCLPRLATLVVALAAAACSTPQRPPRARGYVLPAGTGRALLGPGDMYTFLATGDSTDGALFQFEARVPRGGGPPPHVHHREAETFYLVQGRLEMHLGDDVVAAKAGDYVYVPKGALHWFRNVGDESAVLLVTFAPAGFEGFFEETLEPCTDRSATPPPMSDEMLRRMIEAAPRHGLELPPPPSPR
jgi:mannose-6-phosphate isomerase-like protein (cupin superfamily)